MNHELSLARVGRSKAGAFTLIELTVALFLAVFLMVGVAEIFKISTRTASRVEATGDSYQMARSALSRISEDISQAAPDGYFYVLPQMMRVPLPPEFNGMGLDPGGKPPRGQWATYRFDTLYFTAVGKYRQMGEAVTTPAVSPGAQIFYGPGLRQASKGSMSNAGWRAGIESNPANSDQRGALLIRKVFLQTGVPTSSTSALQLNALPAFSRSSFSQMANEIDTGHITGTLPVVHRVKHLLGADAFVTSYPPVDVAGGPTGFEPNIDLVVADRVSEFFIEVWGYDSAAVPPRMGWIRPKLKMDNNGNYVATEFDRYFIWTLGKKNASVTSVPTMPQMVRLTMVMHPHSDQAPLRPYDNYTNKFVGDVFRRIVRLPGQIAR